MSVSELPRACSSHIWQHEDSSMVSPWIGHVIGRDESLLSGRRMGVPTDRVRGSSVHAVLVSGCR